MCDAREESRHYRERRRGGCTAEHKIRLAAYRTERKTWTRADRREGSSLFRGIEERCTGELGTDRARVDDDDEEGRVGCAWCARMQCEIV